MNSVKKLVLQIADQKVFAFILKYMFTALSDLSSHASPLLSPIALLVTTDLNFRLGLCSCLIVGLRIVVFYFLLV